MRLIFITQNYYHNFIRGGCYCDHFRGHLRPA